jgi:ATP-dependent helicase/DNAse subunit B
VAQRLTSNYFDAEQRFLSECEESFFLTDVERSLNYSLNVDGIDFNLFGNVDRVDRVGDSIRIIDYKSGMVEQKDLTFKSFEELREEPKKAKAFQLMTYAYLYSKSISQDDTSFKAANYSLRNLEDGLIYVEQNKTPLKMDALVLDKFENELKTLLSTILQDDTVFYPTDNVDACIWCDFKSVCGR